MSDRIDPQTGKYLHYAVPIEEIIYESDVKKAWDLCQYEGERVLLSLFWHTAARPSELLEIKRKDVGWGLDTRGNAYFAIRVVTKKLGTGGEFIPHERTLTTSRPKGKDANIYIETIIRWCKQLNDYPDSKILAPTGWGTTRSLNRIMHKVVARIGKQWSPYHWRHSVMTHLARSGMGLSQLMFWKGAKSVESVKFYIHAVPAYVAIENIRKDRDQL